MNSRRAFISFLAASPLRTGTFRRPGARNLREITRASIIRPA
jgi:hypothetical protein